MKLFVIAALVAVAAGARLEHLENSYFYPPPNQGGNGGFGLQGTNEFGVQAFGAAGAGQNNYNVGAFPDATSNQYLPPNQGSSASNGQPQFAGSLQGFGGQNVNSQYSAPSSQFGSPSYQSQYGQQSAATNRQYLAPNAGSYQQTPQQPFDEQTGYHY